MRLSYMLGLGIVLCSLSGCEQIAVLFTPKKQAITSQSELASKAENYFWETLHQGNYQDIPQADYLLMAAYLQNPNDPKLAAHIGLLHLWKITERQREENIPPTITNEIIFDDDSSPRRNIQSINAGSASVIYGFDLTVLDRSASGRGSNFDRVGTDLVSECLNVTNSISGDGVRGRV